MLGGWMTRLGIAVMAVLSTAGCREAPARSSGDSSAPILLQCALVASERDTTCVLFAPSLIQLIARPEAYDGKLVRVIGFANLEFEGNSLYVSREDYDQMLSANGLWLDVADSVARRNAKELPGYFIVEGEFSARDRGHFGMWSGAIKSVTRFEPNASRAEIEARVRQVK